MWMRRILILALPFVLGGCATFFTLLEEVGSAVAREYVLDRPGRSSGGSYRGSRQRYRQPRHHRSRRHR